LTDQALTGVGAQLREAREAAGLAMDDVARSLKLLPRQVESLEHERFERLPGPSIARGMVRNYARLLELDPEPLVERMTPRAETTPEPVPSSTASRRSLLPYVAPAAVLLGLVAAFAYEWQRAKSPVEEVSAPVQPKPAELPRPAETRSAPIEKPPVEKPIEQPAASEKPEPVPAEPKPRAQPILPPGIHRLVLRVEEEAWLEVRDGAGRSLVSSLNPAGTERPVRGQPPFELVIGNAAHVSLTYDGKPVDLTPYIKGEVARFTLP
jgi:cytoskeleton protein RodZ